MKHLLLIAGVMGLVSSWAMAKGSSNLMRGGYGFLFPDANSFINGGQMAQTTGTAVEGYYERNDQVDLQSASPSVVWGSGRVGLGAFASRTGTTLTGDSARLADSVGAGLGVSLAQGKITVGGTLERSIDGGQVNDGVVTAALNYNGSKGRGFHLGGGFSTTLNSLSGTETRTATLATGWGFDGLASFEINYQLKDLDQTSNNYLASGYLNFGGSNYYCSTGYSYDRPSSTSTLTGRVGFIMGSVDFSFHGRKAMTDGNDPFYGATLRTTF
jgi:hypothetical protein